MRNLGVLFPARWVLSVLIPARWVLSFLFYELFHLDSFIIRAVGHCHNCFENCSTRFSSLFGLLGTAITVLRIVPHQNLSLSRLLGTHATLFSKVPKSLSKFWNYFEIRALRAQRFTAPPMIPWNFSSRTLWHAQRQHSRFRSPSSGYIIISVNQPKI